MTALVLTVKNIVLPGFPGYFEFLDRPFVANKHWMVTTFLAGILALAIVVYMVALYVTFGLGFQIQSAGTLLKETQDTVLQLEVTVRGKEADLAKGNQKFLESMEKIAKIRYLQPKSVVISSVSVQP
ncbi:MAG: hypothetical protein HYW89_00255 [Candidatus Sungiibacteriota bacterium]|uniref:Uncharacterized protein n=1 Tax=Candidatus Sungiibacteriota bacterium TaxID=2750080 RepID=A0A7T5RKG9_9BACT|nr:MAG: hypothetical protein HYW89_00255 [Candidatus Sungbacteria bacterium]